ncbi:MAG TPA: HlyD family efflux transporter periplasmic adaptor subunit [Longimicrobiales bacterium]
MRVKRVVPAAVVVVLIALAAWWLIGSGDADPSVVTASGTVEATDADLGFQVAGRLASIAVEEGGSVAAGAELARLELAELEARRASAAAQLAGARAQLAELEHGARPEELNQARAAAAATREQLEDAERVLGRMRALYEGGAVSRQSLDQAATAFEVARAQHEQAREQAELVERGPRAERVAAGRAAVAQAEAQLAQAEATTAHAVIRAPFAGVVTVRHREEGEAVGAGAPVLTVMDPADRWVRIYVREDAIGAVKLGQRAEIMTDSDPSRAYRGRVTYIAGSAEFTPRNVQTREERVKLVYAVKVQIEDDSAMVLKPGVPADVRLLPGP